MEEIRICRCCLVEGHHKDWTQTYVWMDQKEKYSEMVSECFDIFLSAPAHKSSGICEPCVYQLRSSFFFKKQVLKSEKEFYKKVASIEDEDSKSVHVKEEISYGSDGDDSDDYFLADALKKKVDIEEIKVESTDSFLKSISKASLKKKDRSKSLFKQKGTKDEDGRAKKIRKLVTRLASSINSFDAPKPRKQTDKNNLAILAKSKRKVTVKKSSSNNELPLRLVWRSSDSRFLSDKDKHRSNLQNIIANSNAVLFKNPSLRDFSCVFCGATFTDPEELRSHTAGYHQKDRLKYECKFDIIDCNPKLDVTGLKCLLCEENMNNLTVFKEHLVKAHNKIMYSDVKDFFLQFKLKRDVYDCALCPSTYETYKMLLQHMNKHYPNFSCDHCDAAFANRRSLNAHKQTHSDGKFKCEHCDKVFATKTKMRCHEKFSHLGAKNITNCRFCNIPFSSYYQRNQHLSKVHNAGAKYKCNVCDKSFILKSLLMYHIKKSHLMERNFQCDECDYRFFSKKALTAHMVKHTGERSYACAVCSKSYARKYTLREHMRIHNNDRRFKCTVCELSFVQKCSLKSHLLSNHGISMTASEISTS